MMRLGNALAVALTLALTSFVAAQPRGELKVGDPAPGLDVEGWIGDTGVTLTQGSVYILIFFESGPTPAIADGRTLRAFSQMREEFMGSWGKDLRILIVAPDNADRMADSIGSSSRASPERRIGRKPPATGM